jgi:hypothetical protein
MEYDFKLNTKPLFLIGQKLKNLKMVA